MESTFKILMTNRNIHLSFLEKYTLEQLNNTPQGFSNDLVWNVGHIIAVQQRLAYILAGLPMNITDEFFEKHKPGSKPTGNATQTEVDILKGLVLTLAEKTIEDYKNGVFVNCKEITTLTGFNLSSTADAFQFINYHEGLHLGLMMNIRKFV